VRAAHQQITREWWARRDEYDLYASRLVVQECQAGDAQAAADRLATLAGIPLLLQGAEVTELAERLMRGVPLPEKATADSLHIALAAVHGIEYLLTWNCTHIANVALRGRIEAVCRAAGFEPPLICTPEELPTEGLSHG
jgi:predicted nucleic acid-binding protein